MNKRQSGLIDLMPQGGLINAMPESEEAKLKREEVDRKRDIANIPAWVKANADLVGDLEKMSKDDLKLFVILMIMKYGNEKALSEFVVRKLAKTEITLEKYQWGLNDEGRQSGGKIMAERKLSHLDQIKDAVVSILSNSATSDWGNPKIARWLMEPQRQFHKFNKIEVGEQTMTDRVKEIREKYKAAKLTG